MHTTKQKEFSVVKNDRRHDPGPKRNWWHPDLRLRNLLKYSTYAVVVTHPAYLRGWREHIGNHGGWTNHAEAFPISTVT